MRLFRLPLLVAGIVSLVLAVAIGLVRLGWPIPLAPAHAEHLGLHGPLMVGGFLGTVIALERAVALGRAWAYLAPGFSAAGAVWLLAVPGARPGPYLVTAASVVLCAIYAAVLRRQPALFVAVMAMGGAAWAMGNAAWLAGRPFAQVVVPWALFPALTIAGERLELTRFLRPTRLGRLGFLVVACALASAAVVSLASAEAGRRLLGAGLLALASWLARYDIARRTLRQEGLTRYMAVCLLSGYAWLALAGLLAVASPGEFTGPVYDATLHALFVGFVFPMIFGHAPVIFPAVLGGAMDFRPRFYVHLVLLHAGIALRVAGDLDLAWMDGGWGRARAVGGLINAVALAVFLANTVTSLRFRGSPARH